MEKEAWNRELEEVRAELERHKKGTDAETELSKVQQNYQIMKDAYAKLRGEHLEMIRSVSLMFNLSNCTLVVTCFPIISFSCTRTRERKDEGKSMSIDKRKNNFILCFLGIWRRSKMIKKKKSRIHDFIQESLEAYGSRVQCIV